MSDSIIEKKPLTTMTAQELDRVALGKKIHRVKGIAGMDEAREDPLVCMGFVMAQHDAWKNRPRTSGLPDV